MADKRAKGELRVQLPELAAPPARLEDHTILRGTLAAFDLDASIELRAKAFESVFDPELRPALTGALLATGEYQRDFTNSDQHRFGSPKTESVWRSLLVDRGDRSSLAGLRGILGNLLDRVSASPHESEESLRVIVEEFVKEEEAASRLDWRYYLVRYPWMREGDSGTYYGADQRSDTRSPCC